MRIVFDLDDTLVLFVESISEFHNQEYGTNLSKDDFHSYNFWEVWGGTRDEAIDKVEKFFRSPYFSRMKLIEGAKEFVDYLKKDNELYVVTARPHSVDEITKNYVNAHFKDSFIDVLLSNKFGKNGRYRSKSEICDELNPDVVIEDSADYANELVKEGRKIFLFNRPWNINREILPEVIRVNSFSDILAQYKN